jgi:hypothetical protein
MSARRIFTALLAVALITVGACGNGKSGKTAKGTTSSSGVDTTLAGDASATTAPGGATASTTKAGGSATTVKGAGGTAVGAGGPSATKVPAPAVPGTYEYAQSGTSNVGKVPATGTLKVDSADAANNQNFHRAVDPAQPPSDITYAFRTSGPFITATVVRAQGLQYECHFDPGIPAPPWPATDGKPISGHANCGPITVDVSGSITGHRTATVDGKPIDVIVITTTITTHGQIESTSNDVQWWAPSLSLPVHSESKMHGSFGAFAFQSDVTSDLKSTHPR